MPSLALHRSRSRSLTLSLATFALLALVALPASAQPAPRKVTRAPATATIIPLSENWRLDGDVPVHALLLSLQGLANLRLLPLPPYGPELNPVERFGGLLKAAVSNRLYLNLRKLVDHLIAAARPWSTPAAVAGLLHT